MIICSIPKGGEGFVKGGFQNSSCYSYQRTQKPTKHFKDHQSIAPAYSVNTDSHAKQPVQNT